LILSSEKRGPDGPVVDMFVVERDHPMAIKLLQQRGSSLPLC
jgi:hypothetical protein